MNPVGKSGDTKRKMFDVLVRIKDEMENLNLILSSERDSVVKPYLVTFRDTYRENDIELPGKDGENIPCSVLYCSDALFQERT